MNYIIYIIINILYIHCLSKQSLKKYLDQVSSVLHVGHMTKRRVLEVKCCVWHACLLRYFLCLVWQHTWDPPRHFISLEIVTTAVLLLNASWTLYICADSPATIVNKVSHLEYFIGTAHLPWPILLLDLIEKSCDIGALFFSLTTKKRFVSIPAFLMQGLYLFSEL